MKYLILGLFVSTSALAIPMPRVYNWGSRAEVQIWNTDNRRVNCSGPLYITTKSGTSRESVFAFLGPRQNFYRSFYPRNNERIERVAHSIFCY